MDKENIYSVLDETEINQLIITSPANLIDFFNDSLENLDGQAMPHYGRIKGNKEISYAVF